MDRRLVDAGVASDGDPVADGREAGGAERVVAEAARDDGGAVDPACRAGLSNGVAAAVLSAHSGRAPAMVGERRECRGKLAAPPELDECIRRSDLGAHSTAPDGRPGSGSSGRRQMLASPCANYRFAAGDEIQRPNPRLHSELV